MTLNKLYAELLSAFDWKCVTVVGGNFYPFCNLTRIKITLWSQFEAHCTFKNTLKFVKVKTFFISLKLNLKAHAESTMGRIKKGEKFAQKIRSTISMCILRTLLGLTMFESNKKVLTRQPFERMKRFSNHHLSLLAPHLTAHSIDRD